MQGLQVQPFSQFTNWFRLTIDGGAIYKAPPCGLDEEPDEYFLRHDGEYYSLNRQEGYQPVYPSGMLLRRVIIHGFREALQAKDFSFKGFHNYVAYFSGRDLPQPHNDIFSAYTGFEFRVVEYEGEEGPEFHLVINPHTVFEMNVSVGGLVLRNMDPTWFSGYCVKTTDEDAETDGIDGFLVETWVTQNDEISCRITDVRSGAEEIVDGGQVYLEPRPEVIRAVLQELGSTFDVVEFQRDRSFLSSSVASRDRFQKTQEIVRDYLTGKAEVFPLHIGEICVDIAPAPTPVVGAGIPRARQLAEPALLFDQADSSAVHLQPYWGLRTFGAFSKNMPVVRLALLGTKPGIVNLRS